MHLSTVKMPIDLGRDKPSASLSNLIVKSIFLLICAVFVSHLVRPFVNLSETIAGYRSNRSLLLIMLTEPTFCCNSSINISIDNRYDNRFIHLGRLIFTVNHNGACVYTTDYTWDRACVCYTREAPLTLAGANGVSAGSSLARLRHCWWKVRSFLRGKFSAVDGTA